MTTSRLTGICLAILLGVSTPSRAQITVRGRLAHDITATAGETVKGSIVVDNESDQVREARVYQTDYVFDAEGSNTYGEPGTSVRSNAGWITFSPSTLTIPPHASGTIGYSVQAPQDSSISGTYWSMIMVEGIDPATAESSQEEDVDSQEMGFRQTTRYGVQIATHVLREARRDVTFENVQLLADDEGKTMFVVDVINSGTLMMQPDVSMRVFREDGTETDPIQGQQFRIYPGTSVRQRLDLSALESGSYQVLLIVDDGEDAVFGGQYDITL